MQNNFVKGYKNQLKNKTMARVNPYLNFNDNCREAMNFYKDCLGGELTLQTVGESPMAAQMPDKKDAILHASLTIGDTMIMGSDMRRKQLTDGDTVNLCINCTSDEEMKSFFTNLSAGATIREPISEMPGGAKIAALTDKYGKLWMFYYDKNAGANN
jgi:PhnB protein